MILLAIFALGLLGVTATLLAWASVLPRMRTMRRIGQIGAYGDVAVPTGDAAAGASTPVIDDVARRVGAVVSRTIGMREEDLRRHLMAAGVYRLSPNALLGYRTLAAVTMPFLVIAAAPPDWPGPSSAPGAAGRFRSCSCSGVRGPGSRRSTTSCRA
jgi:hypothetical protein